MSIHIFGEGCYTFQPLYKLSKETLLKWSDKVTEFVESGNNQVYAENAMNEISDKKIETADEISVIHVLIAFNTLYRDGVEIVPKN